MKFTVNSNELSTLLQNVGRLVPASNVSMPALANYLFEVTPERISVTGGDTMMRSTGVIAPLECDGDMHFLIAPTPLLDYIKSLPVQPLTLEMQTTEEYLSDDSPFFFSDVDFDGEDEFIINRYKSGSRESNAYDVYDVSPYGYFMQKTEVPFTELENGQCKFDSENKTITVYGSNGWNNPINHTYQLKDRKFELVQSE